MRSNDTTVWTAADFDHLSWHDNHVHGISLHEGEHGTGELILDIDFILEWDQVQDGFQFVIAPANLVFHEVSSLRIEIDYGTRSAAMGPFSIDGIERRFEERERYTAQIWSMEINFPSGMIQFEAEGFTQTLRAAPRRSREQRLTNGERSDA